MSSDLMIKSVCLLILFILLAWVYKDIMIDSKKKYKISLCIFLSAIAIIAEMGCTLMDNTIPEYRIYSVLFNTIGFALTPFILIVESDFYDINTSKKNRYIYIPAFINLVIVLLSSFTGWIFYVSPSNDYYRGEFFYIYLLTFFFSILYSLYKKLKYVSQLPSYFSIKSFFSNLLIFPGFLLQVIFPQYKTTWLLMTFYLVFYYVFSSQMDSLLDGLTGLLNRNAFNQQIKVLKSSINYHTILAMIDIDHFKEINDEKGHLFGDECLQEVTSVLKEVFKHGDQLFRYGGDEFVVLFNVEKDHQIHNKLKLLEDTIEKRRTINSYFPNISYGYALYKPEQSVEEVISIADEMMYKNKRSKLG